MSAHLSAGVESAYSFSPLGKPKGNKLVQNGRVSA